MERKSVTSPISSQVKRAAYLRGQLISASSVYLRFAPAIIISPFAGAWPRITYDLVVKVDLLEYMVKVDKFELKEFCAAYRYHRNGYQEG